MFSSFYCRLIRSIFVGILMYLERLVFFMNQYNNHSVLATLNSTLFWLQLYEKKKYQAAVILIKNSINIYS
jgi:hypothetical protein